MKLRFENWYENQIFEESACELFKESVICFKSGAYRASVMMAYLGLQTELKYRLVNSSIKPDNIPNNLWSRILKDLSDDNIWDNAVFDCVNRTKPDNPFLISNDIREQYSYWRNIRNVCAHAKNNIISYPHVEAIWLFIESNMGKFLINGGKVGLLEKINRHYDIRYTPEGQSESQLVKLIPNTIERKEIVSFFEDVKRYFDEEVLSTSYLQKNKKTYGFWESVIFSDQIILREEFLKYLKVLDVSTLFEFLDVFPELINEYINNEPNIRKLWVQDIWEVFAPFNKTASILLVKLIKDSKIASSEYDIISKELVKLRKVPTEIEIEILKEIGYFKRLKQVLFDSENLSMAYSGINFGNEKWYKIEFYLKNVDLDTKVVEEINSAFNAARYGIFYEGFKQFIINNEDFKQKYKTIALANKLNLDSIFD